MFVRWKKESLTPDRPGAKPRYTHYAYLAKSVRVNGKPRQEIVGYLGSIQEPVNRIGWSSEFWFDVERTLRRLEVDHATFEKITSLIAERIPRPDDAVMEETYSYNFSDEENKAREKILAYHRWLKSSDIAMDMTLQLREQGLIPRI